MPFGSFNVIFARFVAVVNRLLRVVVCDERSARCGGVGLFFVALRSFSMLVRGVLVMFRCERMMLGAGMVRAHALPFRLPSCREIDRVEQHKEALGWPNTGFTARLTWA